MTPSKALFWFCIVFVVGIFLASVIKIPQIFSWVFLFLGTLAFFTATYYQNKRLSIFVVNTNSILVLGFCSFFLVLGIMRFQISEFTISQDTLSQLNDNPEKIYLVGQIIAEPDIRDTMQKLKIRITDTKSIVLVTAQRYPEYHYLDVVQINGKLKNPPNFEDFNYKNYLMKDGIYSVMDFPQIELFDVAQGKLVSQKHDYNIFTYTYEKILFLKGKLMDSVDMNFSPPGSDIIKGVVFGNDKNMSKDTKNQFSATGLSHITAVSGSNIVILIEILMIFLLAVGLWRTQALYLAVILIWIYIVLIGFPVSGIRAGIMGSVGLLAQILGRQNTSARVLVIAGAVMLLQNPLLLLYDIGFQLSFLASLGIIYLKPIIDNLLRFNKKPGATSVSKKKSLIAKAGKILLDIISVTVAAQIFTLPIIVYNFGSISLVAPVTNILVLPIIPLLTVLGFLVSVAGIFSNVLGFIFSLPCVVLLAYIVKVLDIFSKPWAVKTVEHIHWFWPVVYYACLAMVVRFLDKKMKPKFLGY